MTDGLAIEARGLRKRYRDVEALRGIDLGVRAGTVYGLLGPNGAGKTTAVRILSTLLPPSEGTATVAGYDVVSEPAKVRSRIGLASQYAAVDEILTGFENLEMVGRLYHMGREEARERARELLEVFELSDAGDRQASTYSGGMRRRLDLAAALVARPPVIFLDEPTTGLDPRSRVGLWETIEEIVSRGATVLLTTQYLDEAERLADRIAVLDHGLLIAEGTPDELKARVGGDRIEVTLEDSSRSDAALAALSGLASSEDPSCSDGVVSVPVAATRGAIANAVRSLDAAGVEVEDVTLRRPTLNDVFIKLTGHAAEPQDGSEGDGDAETDREPGPEEAAR